MIVALAAVAAFALGVAGPPKPLAFAIDAPAAPGLFRVKPTPEASNAWTISRFQVAAVFDAAGKRLACEVVRWNSPIAQTMRHRVVEGRWLSTDEIKMLSPLDGFTFERVWAFDRPPLDEAEKNVYFMIEWNAQSTIGVGNVQVVPQHPRKDGSGPLTRMSLSDANAHLSPPQSRFYVDGMDLAGQLRFRGTASDLAIDRAILYSATTRPWARAPVDAPGWIIFDGNGRTPYVLQIAYDGSTCSGLNAEKVASLASDPDAPPEVMLAAALPNMGRLGDPPRDLERGRGQADQHVWTVWAIFVGIGFIVACLLAIATDKHQRRGTDV